MRLNYVGLIFIIFGIIILFFRKYFLNASMESKSFYGDGMDGNVKWMMLINKICKNPITFSGAQNRYMNATKVLIFLTSAGFIVVGLLILLGLIKM
jgi:hypothetical protein